MAPNILKSFLNIALTLLILTAITSAQDLPANAHVNLYFPQVVDGGSEAQSWQTSITFVNVNAVPASVQLEFHGSGGDPLLLDFGEGPNPQLIVEIPAVGTRTVRTRLGSEEIVSGWAYGNASAPVLATLTFTQLVGGQPQLSVSAPPTVPNLYHLYPANYFLSVAIANRYANAPANVWMTVYGPDGQVVAEDQLTLPPNGHTAFTLWQRFPGLPRDFEGSFYLHPGPSGDADDNFVAWAMGSDSSGVISSLPDGRWATPREQWDEIWRVFQHLEIFAKPWMGLQPVNLSINYSQVVNATATRDTVTIYAGLAELIADSPSELAFAIAHELGHVYQRRTGRREFRIDNAESDADGWGLYLTWLAGYDPYAIAGTLSKLAMATNKSNLSGQFFEDLLAVDAHKSFSTRIDEMFGTIVFMCSSSPQLQTLCQNYKALKHPRLPSDAPLMEIVRESSEKAKLK